MSNRDSRHTAPQPAPAAPRTDRPTATYPTGYPLPEGWRVDPRPRRYLDPADAADASRLAQADATPTGVFPIRRSIRPGARPAASPGAPDRPQREGAGRPARGGGGQADAASLSHGGAHPRAVYHTAPAYPSVEQAATSGAGRRQARRRHLRAAMTGIALAAAVLTGLQLYALDGIIDAREAARAASSATPSPAASLQPATPSAVSGQTTGARTGTQPDWVTSDTHAPFDRTDPAASPLDLPRCTTGPDTPMPCLAHISNDSRHVTVLEEDASLTGLVRR